MFRTSCVHHQEDHLYMQFYIVRFHAEITIKLYKISKYKMPSS